MARRPPAPRRPSTSGRADPARRPTDQRRPGAQLPPSTPRERDRRVPDGAVHDGAVRDRPTADRSERDRPVRERPALERSPGARPSEQPSVPRRAGALVPAADRFRDLMRPRPWRRRRRTLVLSGALVLLLTLAALGTLLLAPWFRIAEVSVSGATYVDPAAVTRSVEHVRGESVLTVPTGELEREAEAVPGVADATVTRSWPDGIAVHITERTPIATVTGADGATVIVDAHGIPLPDAAGEGQDLVPLAVGEGTSDPGGTSRAMLEVLASLPTELRERVTAVTATAPSDVTLAITTDDHGDKTLVWGGTQDAELKAEVAAALLEAPGSVIDVSSPVAPVTR